MINNVTNSLFYVFADGVPVPQGSKSAAVVRGKAVMFEANKKTKAWREHVTNTCITRGVWTTGAPFNHPVRLVVSFMFPRLKKHLRANGAVKENAPTLKSTKPDVDKLVRSVCDSLTDAGVITDDSRVSQVIATKYYADNPEHVGVYISVEGFDI